MRALVAERPELACVVEPMLSAREALMQIISALDREVADRAKQRSACRLLMTAPRIGPQTALAYCSMIEDAECFTG